MAEHNHVFGPFVFDGRRMVLLKHGAPVVLGQKGLALLGALMAASGRVVPKSELMDAAWGSQNIEESNLSVQIAALRKCLGRTRNGDEWITTVQRVGYQFVDPGAALGALTAPHIGRDGPSVAVLPFANMSGDPGQEYFSDGVSEDIITELSRWRLLSVRSRAASFRYRELVVDIRQVARELNVRYVVEGSVRRMGERVRVAVQLIDAETGNHVWAERFDRDHANFFTVQDQVVRTIVSTLMGRVYVDAVERIGRKPPASLAAYECALMGNALRWDEPDAATEAARLFAQAIELDPGYGFAHAGLAMVHHRTWFNHPKNSDAALDEAHRLAKRAVELDGGDSACFAALGVVCMHRRSHEVALRHLERAVELNPNNQWNAADMGIVLMFAAQAEAAVISFNRARDIDPYFDAPWYWPCLGRAQMILRRYEEALAAFERAVTRNYRDAACMAACLARLGDTERAAVLACESLAMRPEFAISQFMSKAPFKNPDDAAHLAESLRMAGLPA